MMSNNCDNTINSQNKKRKAWYYNYPIGAIILGTIVVWGIPLSLFLIDGVLPTGSGLDRSDWLSFVSNYGAGYVTALVAILAIRFGVNSLKQDLKHRENLLNADFAQRKQQFENDLTQRKKQFEEDLAFRREQFQEDLVQRKQILEADLQQRNQQFQINLNERKRMHDEDLALRRKIFEDEKHERFVNSFTKNRL
ncbi:MAG: hypothetical protein FWB80_03140 [Defluviitaleaceae bacterium]|nr:hypothetical protein [Defluviitaleaceae bacterium]